MVGPVWADPTSYCYLFSATAWVEPMMTCSWKYNICTVKLWNIISCAANGTVSPTCNSSYGTYSASKVPIDDSCDSFRRTYRCCCSSMNYSCNSFDGSLAVTCASNPGSCNSLGRSYATIYASNDVCFDSFGRILCCYLFLQRWQLQQQDPLWPGSLCWSLAAQLRCTPATAWTWNSCASIIIIKFDDGLKKHVNRIADPVRARKSPQI